MWESCCDDPLWQAVCWATDLSSEIPAVPVVKLKASAAPQAEPVGGNPPDPEKTPEKKKKKQKSKKVNSPDSMTPEKPKSARRRNVPHVDGARPADFGQPRKVDPTLKPARKKRTMSQAFAEKAEAELELGHPDDALALAESGSED